MTPEATASPNSIITSVTLTKGVTGDQIEPVNPTKIFSPTDVIYAVVAIKDAPDNTKITSSWYVVNVGSAAKANSLIDSADLTDSGTTNLDFSLTPSNPLPVGTYKVVILVDGKKMLTVDFSVK